MPVSRPPVVRDTLLYAEPATEPIPVGSPAWFSWLGTAKSFAFSGAAGNFTARHEERSGSRFWYAYRRRKGTLRKAYLGRSPELAHDQLERVASSLSAARAGTPDNPDAAWSLPLIATKIAPPQPGLSLIDRPAVLRRCLECIERPCALIAAPPGFGKTTLLLAAAEHLRERGWALAWISLEESEREPARFWTYVLAALDRAHPGVAETARRLLAAPRTPPIERVLIVLINALAASPTPLVLVFDDYHRAATQANDDAMAFLIDHAPSTLHLVVSSRTDPAFLRPRLRASGRVAELHAADLRFTLDEAGHFMDETMHVSIPPEQLARLAERTEGWVAGLQLAALSLRDQPVPRAPASAAPDGAASTTPRFVADFFIEEVLRRQPEAMQTFLLQTAPLERLSGPLCDAVTRRTDSAEVLAHLMRAQLFVTPLDPDQTWYRYHHLFADVLRARLERTAPEMLNECHRRAAEWLSRHEMTGEAIRHLLAARAYRDAAPLLEGELERFFLRGEVSGLLTQVLDLPREIILDFPHLAVLAAAAMLLRADVAGATELVDALDAHLIANGTRTRERAGEIAAVRALLRLFTGEIDAGIALAREAVGLLPAGNHVLRALAVWITSVLGLLGDERLSDADRAMAEIARESVRAGNLLVAVLAVVSQGEIQLYQARLHRAAQTVREAQRLLPRSGEENYLFAATILCLQGEIQREWNDLDSAEASLRRALAVGNLDMIVEGPISLALVHAARGQFDQALALFEEMAAHQVSPWDFMQIEAMRVRVLIASGQLAEAIRWAEAHPRAPRTDPALPVLFNEMQELSRARISLACNRPAEVIAPLEAMCVRATRAERLRNVLEARMLLASARWMLDDGPAALQDLSASLALAAPEGFSRVYLDEGEPMADLLAAYFAGSPASIERTYALKLLAAFGRAVDASAPPQSVRLSSRELDVLRLLSRGRSTENIAGELVLAPSTVKWHIAQIYRKLGVTGRVQATIRARELRLIA